MIDNGTICALSTPSGAGAISIIRVSGPGCFPAVDACVTFRNGTAADAGGFTVKYGVIHDGEEILDEVLVSIFRAPNSYSGEDSAEINCHASAYIASRILELLCAAGCRMAGPGEFTQRAFLNGKMDLSQAEAVANLISASSRAAHRVAVNQLRGVYSSELKELRLSLVELSSLLELELDFSEENVEFADRERLDKLLEDSISHVSVLSDSFRAGNAIKNGVPVAIVGNVNAGKSTLLNALVGDDRAIVSDIAGTTRDTVEETVNINGVSYRFIDTAGIRDTDEYVEKKGVERSLAALESAAVVIIVLDATAGFEEIDRQVCEYRERVADSQGCIFVLNKSDIAESPYGNYPDYVRISALTGDGLDKLRIAIERNSPAYGALEGTVVTSERHYAALKSALADLERTRSSLDTGLSTELIAEDLRSAISSISSIIGDEITTDEVLGQIFGKFCIGK